MRTILLCGKLFTAVDERVRENMAVIVEGNKITDVIPAAESWRSDDTVIDLRDKFVMPGLIDAHLHVNFGGSPSMDYMHQLTVGDFAFESLVNAEADLMAGFTTVRDVGATGYSDVALRNAINAGKIKGPRMKVAGCGIGSTGGHADAHFNPYITVNSGMGIIIDSPDAARRAVRQNVKYGVDLIKVMATGGVMSFGDDVGAAELSYEEMKVICDEATAKGKPTAAHAHGTAGIKIAVQAGITSIEHGTLVDEEGIEMMAAAGTYVVPTASAAHNIIAYGVESGIPAWAVEKCKGCYERYSWTIPNYLKKGVKVGIGSDCGTPFNRHGKQGQEFGLLAGFGMPAVQTLLAGTRVNAELLRMEKDIGTLEAGKFADVVAFDKNPLDDLAVMTATTFVMKDGVVYKSAE